MSEHEDFRYPCIVEGCDYVLVVTHEEADDIHSLMERFDAIYEAHVSAEHPEHLDEMREEFAAVKRMYGV